VVFVGVCVFVGVTVGVEVLVGVTVGVEVEFIVGVGVVHVTTSSIPVITHPFRSTTFNMYSIDVS